MRAAVQRGKDMLAELAAARVDASDDDGAVVATADGLGRIIDLHLSEEALRHPRLLGEYVTAAVRHAKQVGSAAAEERRRAYFPDSPALAEVQASMSPPPDRAGRGAVDYPGSSEVRDMLAEGVEARQRAARAHEEFEEHPIYQEIGVGAGTVEMNAAATHLQVDIRPEAVRRVGAGRLAGQIVEAVREAERRAEEFRFSTLDRISVGETAVGALMRAARRRLGIAELREETNDYELSGADRGAEAARRRAAGRVTGLARGDPEQGCLRRHRPFLGRAHHARRGAVEGIRGGQGAIHRVPDRRGPGLAGRREPAAPHGRHLRRRRREHRRHLLR
ncbi:MAG: hypothetical protein GEV03_10700 [Streptosporangiales bacterium]|nr:hypothetical protein [Streptosporangiales bacterium]